MLCLTYIRIEKSEHFELQDLKLQREKDEKQMPLCFCFFQQTSSCDLALTSILGNCITGGQPKHIYLA